MIERLLRTHFIRRFLDNDLISPDADRHEVLSTLAGILMGGGLFVTMLMGLKYLLMPFQSPGRTAIGALSDRFFLYGCSMEVTALAALLSWSALSLDARDIAILGPLPIERRHIVRAKLAAVALVAAGFAVGLNAVTGVLYPILLVGKLPAGLATTAGLIAVHAAICLAAGAFGFLAVLAARELLHALLGTARFARLSVPAHALLTVAVTVTLLLLPGMSSDAARQWLVPLRDTRWLAPPLWFVGLHEYIAGDTVMGLRFETLPFFIAEYEAKHVAVYEEARPSFPGLAAAAGVALPLLALLALPAYWWNNRRIDGSPAVAPARRRVLTHAAAALVNATIVRHPAAQAGFWLACRAVTRSLPHRMAVAFGLAIGLATLVVSLRVAWVTGPSQAIPLSALVPQLVLLGGLVISFHKAVGIAADLRASWLFKVAWLGEARRYIAGVKRFALVGLVVPAAVLLIPLHAPLLGWTLAAGQAVLGVCIAAVVLQGAFVRCDRLPFAVPRAATGNLKMRGPVYLVATIGLVYWLARLVRVTLQSGPAFGMVIGAALVVYAALASAARRQERDSRALELDDAPEEVTQRLGLVR